MGRLSPVRGPQALRIAPANSHIPDICRHLPDIQSVGAIGGRLPLPGVVVCRWLAAIIVSDLLQLYLSVLIAL